MSDEEDPEVRRDLELRESSRYDRSRSRISEAAIGNATVAATVAYWSCRNRVCRKPCAVGDEAIFAFEVHNRQLRARGEEPLNTAEIMICADCRTLSQRKIADRNRERVEELRGLIQRMKQSTNPRAEHDLIRQMTDLRHPDVTGLIESLAAKLEKPGKGTGRKKL